jgi:hypothetical protein
MHFTVGQEPYEMEGLARAEISPEISLKYSARRDPIIYQTRALTNNPAGTHCVVSHFGVAHVIVRRETHGQPVSSQTTIKSKAVTTNW